MKLQKIFASLLTIALGLTSANAQLLWRVTGNGVKDATYLFGTHHLAPIAMLDSVAGFSDALSAVDEVVGEIDMATATDPANIQIMQSMAMLPADSLLTAILPAERIDSINAVLSKYTGGQLSVEQMAQVKPAFIASQLAIFEHMTDPEMAATVSSGEQLDSKVQQLAREAGKSVEGFETLKQQMQFLMGNPIAEQVEDLMEAVRDIMGGTYSENARKLNRAYLSQNLDAIAEIFLDPKQMSAEEMKRLVNDRNAAWVEKLSLLMPEHSVLVAVGCGHLPGEKGLIELLRQKGYTLEPVNK